MALVVTSEPAGELLSVEEAKRHLRIYDDSSDDEVLSLIQAARDYCERHTGRTLRGTTTRTLTLDEWWCDEQKLPWPPLISVTGVTYYDSDNATQTLSSSNYLVELSTNGGGRIVWAADATIPATYTRPNAITITFTAGYTTLPPVALQAMKTMLTGLWGAGTDNDNKAAEAATMRLLSTIDFTDYV